MPAIVELEKCEGCGDCVEACATGAIVMENDKAVIKNDDCCECSACVDGCQQRAITMG